MATCFNPAFASCIATPPRYSKRKAKKTGRQALKGMSSFAIFPAVTSFLLVKFNG